MTLVHWKRQPWSPCLGLNQMWAVSRAQAGKLSHQAAPSHLSQSLPMWILDRGKVPVWRAVPFDQTHHQISLNINLGSDIEGDRERARRAGSRLSTQNSHQVFVISHGQGLTQRNLSVRQCKVLDVAVLVTAEVIFFLMTFSLGWQLLLSQFSCQTNHLWTITSN